MKKLALIIAFLLPTVFVGAQIAYVLPSPTDASAEITLYIDVSQSTENGLRNMLLEHPDDPVYLWSWEPAEPVVGNGQWAESNEALLMTKESELLYSITFVPTEFYGVDGSDFFNTGISCLAKLGNGNEYPDDGFGEAKTEDINVEIVPKLCDDVMCIFPEIKRQDDFLSITYDNLQEPNTALQNMGDEECYLFIGYILEGGGITPYVPTAEVTNHPELQMKRIAEDGHFRLTIIPEDFLGDLLMDGDVMERLRVFIVREGVGTGGSPTLFEIPFLICGE
jgi:hypothetical protein